MEKFKVTRALVYRFTKTWTIKATSRDAALEAAEQRRILDWKNAEQVEDDCLETVSPADCGHDTDEACVECEVW